ncbi:chemotaxis protein CheA [Allonocardiopsis opalescens]|nr:chemotaxis protein CheA [Allonocardiopsis opalescens]
MVIPTLLAAAFTFVFAGAAQAEQADTATAPSPSEVASALRSDPLFVDPAVEGLSGSQADAIRSAAQNAGSPLYYVILPEGSLTTRAETITFLDDVRADVGEGTYAALVGGSFVPVSDTMSDSQLADMSAAAGGEANQTDALVRFAAEMNEAEEAGAAGGVFGAVLAGILVLGLVGGGFFVYNSRRKRERAAAEQLAQVKQIAAEDVTRLGEDIAGLDINLTDPALDDATRDDYTHAMDSYDRSKSALDSMRQPEDVRNVTNALEDGRYYMVATRARLNGDPVPERNKPCFFNPQHGPSDRKVMWAPPGGSPREVPACAADALAVEQGGDPDARLVEVDGRRVPYYDAGPQYAPYASGYYGMDMMSGMFMGMMLGSMMGGFGGMGYADPGAVDAGAGDAGGDMGGGDWGGGDFGGGDFGGGDFGGFDF